MRGISHCESACGTVYRCRQARAANGRRDALCADTGRDHGGAAWTARLFRKDVTPARAVLIAPIQIALIRMVPGSQKKKRRCWDVDREHPEH